MIKKKIFAKALLSLCLVTTLLCSNTITVEAGCEVAQCDFVVRHDRRFGDVVCGKIFYAYWSGFDPFGAKSLAAWCDAQTQLTSHKIDKKHIG